VREFVKLAEQLPARRVFVKCKVPSSNNLMFIVLSPHKVDPEHKSLIHHVLLNASDQVLQYLID
jgi:hypothetical protein